MCERDLHAVILTVALLFSVGKNGATNRACCCHGQPVSADRASLEIHTEAQRRVAGARELRHCSEELHRRHARDVGIERDDAWLRNVSGGDVSIGCFSLAILRREGLNANSIWIDVSPAG
jgi:hypothetical protein